MKTISVLALCFAALSPLAYSQKAKEAPKKLSALPAGETIRGEVVIVKPPQEIQVYLAKVEAAAKSQPEWFREFSKTLEPGLPLPFHENLGLTQEEFEEYNKLWDARDFQKVEDVIIHLDEAKEGEWSIRVSGAGTPISLMRFKDDSFRSPNGELVAIEDIDAKERSILGGWTGHEWKYEEDTVLGQVKENLAIGKMKTKHYGLLIYRLQEVTSSGRPIIDRSVVIRFPIKQK